MIRRSRGSGCRKLQYDLLAAYYDNASPAVDRLIQLGALDPIILPNYGYSPNPVTDPDYFAELPENHAPYGRVLTAKSPPGSFEFPGLYLSEGMLTHLRSRNVPILLNHRVTEVVQNGHGEVIGVQVENNGCTQFIRGKRGVIFGSGGFAHDRDKLRSHLTRPHLRQLQRHHEQRRVRGHRRRMRGRSWATWPTASTTRPRWRTRRPTRASWCGRTRTCSSRTGTAPSW